MVGGVEALGRVFAEVLERELLFGKPLGERTHDDRAGRLVGELLDPVRQNDGFADNPRAPSLP
jgi:hypothetical protein